MTPTWAESFREVAVPIRGRSSCSFFDGAATLENGDASLTKGNI